MVNQNMSVLDKNFTTIFHSVKITFISKKNFHFVYSTSYIFQFLNTAIIRINHYKIQSTKATLHHIAVQCGSEITHTLQKLILCIMLLV
jgi:hypothetical protein